MSAHTHAEAPKEHRRANGHAGPSDWTPRIIALWDVLIDEQRELFRGSAWRAGVPHDPVRNLVAFMRQCRKHYDVTLDDLLSVQFDDGFGGGTYGSFHAGWAQEMWDAAERREDEEARQREEAKRKSGQLRILSDDDLMVSPTRDYLIKGWISPAEISLVVGAKNSRKSFLMLHCARAVAQGRSVFGRRVKQAAVLYVVCEGEHGIAKRNRALVDRYGKSTNFHAIAQPVDLLRCEADRSDLQDLIDAAKTHNVRWIIIDTVSRVMPGAKENSPEDMGMFLHNLNLLRHETGAHVTGVHHGTKEDGTNSRGHSTLPNGADVIMQLEWTAVGTSGVGTASIGFARDDKTGTLGSFRAEEVVLGQDSDGDDETTLVVEELDPSEVSEQAKDEKRPPTDDKQKRMLTIFHNVMAKHGTSIRPMPEMPQVVGVRRSILQDELIRAGWFPEDVVTATVCGTVCEGLRGGKLKKPGPSMENNALTGLEKRGFLAFNREYVWQI